MTYTPRFIMSNPMLNSISKMFTSVVAVFYKSRRIPILLPLFIAITALSRMIILQGKGSDPQNLIYEAGAVLLLAIACLIVSQKSVSLEANTNKVDNFDLKK